MEFFTAGIYDKTQAQFFSGLRAHGIDLLVDTRRRRGLRGSTYAFGNSARMQKGLKELGIGYRHELGLAPPEEVRTLQFYADRQQHTSGHSRHALNPAFVQAYTEEVLDQFDFEEFIDGLTAEGIERVAFLCVEAHAEACHRSLIARRLQERFGAGKIEDI